MCIRDSPCPADKNQQIDRHKRKRQPDGGRKFGVASLYGLNDGKSQINNQGDKQQQQERIVQPHQAALQKEAPPLF